MNANLLNQYKRMFDQHKPSTSSAAYRNGIKISSPHSQNKYDQQEVKK